MKTIGGAAAVVSVKDSEILALATYPTYSQRTYQEDYKELSQDPAAPYHNRAVNGAYAPGSTFKPMTAAADAQRHRAAGLGRDGVKLAGDFPVLIGGDGPGALLAPEPGLEGQLRAVLAHLLVELVVVVGAEVFRTMTAAAALEAGIIDTKTKINTLGHWTYPGDPNSHANCWLYNSGGGRHGPRRRRPRWSSSAPAPHRSWLPLWRFPRRWPARPPPVPGSRCQWSAPPCRRAGPLNR